MSDVATITQTDAAPMPAQNLTPIQRLARLLEGDDMRSRLSGVLAQFGVEPETFVRSALNAVSANPTLLDSATIGSIASAVLRAAALNLNLDPSVGHAFIVPRQGAAVLQVSYKGRIEMAYRSGRVLAVRAGNIHANDQVEIVEGTAPDLRIRRGVGDRGEVIGYYAVADLPQGSRHFVTLTVAEAHAIRDAYSDGWKRRGAKSPWGTEPHVMAQKSAVVRLLRTLPSAVAIEDVDVEDIGGGRQVIDATATDATPAPARIAHDLQTGEVLPTPAPQARTSRRLAALARPNH
jgi:recombination protein RecT